MMMLSIGVKKKAFMYIVTRPQDEKEVRFDGGMIVDSFIYMKAATNWRVKIDNIGWKQLPCTRFTTYVVLSAFRISFHLWLKRLHWLVQQ